MSYRTFFPYYLINNGQGENYFLIKGVMSIY
jgi:hypothetical protein